MTATPASDVGDERPSLRRAVRVGCAIFFSVAGLNHFITLDWYLANQMPPWVPFPLAALYLTGVAEIAGGIGLLVRPLRVWAMRGLLLLLVAILPANVHMFHEALSREGWSLTAGALLLRLPVQALFLYAVWWSSRQRTV